MVPRNSETSTSTSSDDGNILREEKGMLVIDIKDSGAGIHPENQKRLFKEIIQFNPEELQGGGGSGLGLFISKAIVDMHGGRLSVHSEGEGKGSTFRLEIPMTRHHHVITQIYMPVPIVPNNENNDDCGVESNITADTISKNRVRFESNSTATNIDINYLDTSSVTPSEASSNKSPLAFQVETEEKSVSAYTEMTDMEARSQITYGYEINRIPRKKLKILVVDDSKLNRKFLIRLLEDMGHSCDEAANGKIALNKVKETLTHSTSRSSKSSSNVVSDYYDIIFMDCLMPEMNGFISTQEIRKLGCQSKIIGLTGSTLDEDYDIFKTCGASVVLVKPIQMDLLQQEINV